MIHSRSSDQLKAIDVIIFWAQPGSRKVPEGSALFERVPRLVCGRAGCGKTLFSVEFLVHGAMQYDEPGVFVAFEETEEDLTKNVASLGYDLSELCRRKKLMIDYIRVERSEIEVPKELIASNEAFLPEMIGVPVP